MNKIIRFVCPGLAILFSLVGSTGIKAQSKPDPETTERIFSFWSLTMEQVKVDVGADDKEFGVYQRFYAHQIDSMEGAFSRGVNQGSINLSTVKSYMGERKTILSGLFEKFRGIEKEFPSSVDEYRTKKRPRLGADSCFSSCYNTGFEDGTFDGWYGYYAINNSTTTGFAFSTPVGGYLGAVTKGAFDPNTGTAPGDYQLRITSGTVTDPFLNTYSTYSMSEVSPYGGNHSVMLGDSTVNGNGVSILSQSFQVPSNTASITYQYSVLLENPHHNYYEQPFFSATVLDQNGDTIPGCGSYYKNASFLTSSSEGFIPIPYPVRSPEDSVWWLNWNLVNVPLKNYVGQCVTIVFEVVDCSLGGHFGYAYVDASCTPENVISSSPEFCGQDSIVLTAPPGWGRYYWFANPDSGIISNDTLQTIDVKDSGTYYVVLTSFSGATCSDTLSIHLGTGPGPIPQPSFHANQVCAGENTTFVNTSNPLTGASFYWDFYNIGTYQDSLITNPTWSYSSPGVYVVKLYEINNGCGAYAYDTITVDSSITGAFVYDNTSFGGCAPATVTFTNRTTGATSYYWNFGNPSSGTLDTSTSENSSHLYDSGGTYTVTLIVGNGGGCPDTVRQTIVIPGPPKPVITGSDSVCSGGTDTLTATGTSLTDANFVWEPGGATTSSITISITGTTTYTLTANSPCGTSDTTFVVYLASSIVASVNANINPVCSGDTAVLTAGGGGTYLWNTGATTSSISVDPTTTTNYTVHVFAPGTTCSDSAVITLNVTSAITSTVTAVPDSVCSGGTSTLSVTSSSGTTSYLWSTGSTTSSITVNPANTTTYYVLISGSCANDSVSKTVNVIAPPKPVITGNDSVCAGGFDTLTGTGGTSYVWQPGGLTNSTITVSTTSTTTYTLTATNACGSHDTTFIVNTSPPPVASVSANKNPICSGDTVILTGGGGGNYVWNTGATTSSITVYPTGTTSYTVHVFTPGTTCSDSAEITINVTPPITSTVTATPDSICSGASATLSVTSSGSVSYLWSNSSTASSITVNPTNTSTYYVVVTGSCTNDTISQTVATFAAPKPVISGTDSVCAGGTATLSVTGGASYVWEPGGQTGSSITVTTSGTTVYTVTATNSCASHDTTFTVNIASVPIALLNANNNSICAGDTVLLTAGGGSTYVWNDGETVTSRTVTPPVTTSYTVHVYNGYGCTDSAVVTINVTQSITSTVSASANNICSGTSTTLSVSSSSGPPTYLWNTGSTESSITVTPLTTTTYYVLTAGTCANDSIALVVNVVPTPSVTLSYPDTACNGGATVITASGASSYLWGNGTTSNSNTVFLNGDSVITVIGFNGSCTDTVRKIVHVYPALTSVRLTSDTICLGGATVVSVSVSGGHPAYSYAWNNGITADSAGPIHVTVPPTQYICTITDACGQVLIDTVNITVRPAPNAIFIPTPDTVLGGGFVNFINLTTGASSYLWNLGDGTTTSDSAPYYEYNQAGAYIVTLYATNQYGCKDSVSESIFVLEKIVIPNVFTPNGDGIDDVFQVTASGMKTYDIQIFDRWGDKVFESESPNISWTGRSSSGVLESAGTYYYVIEATDFSGKNYNLNGFLQLLR